MLFLTPNQQYQRTEGKRHGTDVKIKRLIVTSSQLGGYLRSVTSNI